MYKNGREKNGWFKLTCFDNELIIVEDLNCHVRITYFINFVLGNAGKLLENEFASPISGFERTRNTAFQS